MYFSEQLYLKPIPLVYSKMKLSNVFMSISDPSAEQLQWRWANLYTNDFIRRNGALDLVLWTQLPANMQDNCEICFSPLCDSDRPSDLYPAAASFAYRNAQLLSEPNNDLPVFACTTTNQSNNDRRVEVFHTSCLLAQVVQATAANKSLNCVVLNTELRGTLFVGMLGEQELLELLDDDLDLSIRYQDAMLKENTKPDQDEQWKLATTAIFDQANEFGRIYWESGRGPDNRLTELRKNLLRNTVWPLVHLVTFGSVEQIERQLGAEQRNYTDDWRLINVAVQRNDERIMLAVILYAKQTVRNSVGVFDDDVLENIIENRWFSVVRAIAALNDRILFTVVPYLTLGAAIELIRQPFFDSSTRALLLTGYLKEHPALGAGSTTVLVEQLSQTEIGAIPFDTLQQLLTRVDEPAARSLAINHAEWFLTLDQQYVERLLREMLRSNADALTVRGFDSLAQLGIFLGDAVQADNLDFIVYLLQTRKYRYREEDLVAALLYMIGNRIESDNFSAVDLVLQRIDRPEPVLKTLLDAALSDDERAYLETWARNQPLPQSFNSIQLATYQGDVFLLGELLANPSVPSGTLQQLLMFAAILTPFELAIRTVDVLLSDNRHIADLRWPLIYDSLLSRLVNIPSRLAVLRQLLADRRNALSGERFLVAFDVALYNERRLAMVALINDARTEYEVHFEEEHYTDQEFSEFEEYVDVSLADYEAIEPIGRSVRALVAANDTAGLAALATHTELLDGSRGGLLELGFHLLDGEQLQPVQVAILKEPVLFPVLTRLYVDASNERMQKRIGQILVELFSTGEELDTPPEEELLYFLVYLIRNGPVELLQAVRPLFSDRFIADVLADRNLFANGYDADTMEYLRPNAQ